MLRLYLDPFVFFKSIAIGAPAERVAALHYNRRHRRILLAYVKRWAVIGLVCAGGMFPLAAAARAEPILCVPILGLELGFSTAVCVLFLALAVYYVLGQDR
jgi:hypothetical protein